MRKPNLFKILPVTLITALLLSGCSAFQRNPDQSASSSETEEENTNLTDITKLEDNSFYIRHGEEFLPLYTGNTNFDTTQDTVALADDSRVMWFTDDWENIPTL